DSKSIGILKSTNTGMLTGTDGVSTEGLDNTILGRNSAGAVRRAGIRSLEFFLQANVRSVQDMRSVTNLMV
ncbi:MAG: hypothetical protein K8S54_09080, partial [Spirochaetia bacterium]|nr:hypothetical protein [Spirochaetia bacterium]